MLDWHAEVDRRCGIDRYDVVVIGSGPGGHGAAIQAAKLGKKVAVVERSLMLGGSSISTGSIPSKTLREAVVYLTGLRQRNIYGLSYSVKKDISVQDLVVRTEHVVRTEREVVKSQFARNGVTVLVGEASFQDPHRLSVKGEGAHGDVEAEFVVLAVGSAPARPGDIPFDGKRVIDSDRVYDLPSIPRTMTVVGGGAVGVEYACIFSALGTKVTLVDQRRDILEFVDGAILEDLFYHMRQRGVTFRLDEKVTKVDSAGKNVVAHTASNKQIRGQVLLYTAGREGCTRGLGLEAIGLEVDGRGRLTVNKDYQTAIPHVYAVGDVVGFPALAATSVEQGRTAVRHALGVSYEHLPSLLPYGLHTIPEVSMVGQTEEQLTAARTPYEVGVAPYRETARGQIIGDRIGLLKLLVHPTTRKVLGVHIIGEGATELVHIGQVLIALDGTIDFLVENTFNYPTLAEAYRIAALDAVNKLT